jgi:hypothetical protein
MGYLMKRHEAWSGARIKVFTAEERFRTTEGEALLAREIEDARIDAKLEVLDQPDLKRVVDRCAQSDMVFLPFRFKSDQIITLFDRPAFELMRWLTSTMMIQAAEDIDLDATPESGEAAERAEIRDLAEEAREKAGKARKEAEAARERAEKATEKLASLKMSQAAPKEDDLQKAEKEIEAARTEADKSERRAAKAEAKADMAREEAAQIDPGAIQTQKDED